MDLTIKRASKFCRRYSCWWDDNTRRLHFVFHLFVHLGFGISYPFMRGEPVYGQNAQLNSIQRCKYHIQMNNFKPVQRTVVTTLFKNEVYALKEGKKILGYIGKQECPCESRTIRDNMLRSTVLHDELNAIQSNEEWRFCSKLGPKRLWNALPFSLKTP